MGLTVDWDDCQTCTTIRYEFVGTWEWYDFAQASTQAFRLMSEVPHEVSLILDLNPSLDVPTGALRAVQRLLQFAPANIGIIVITSEDKLTQQTFIALLKIDKDLRSYLAFAKTLEDARLLIEHYHAQEVG